MEQVRQIIKDWQDGKISSDHAMIKLGIIRQTIEAAEKEIKHGLNKKWGR